MQTTQIQQIFQESGAKVLVIAGPTASGKSSLAVEMALLLNGEIVSADSRQVYKFMDVGTGKVTSEEMKGVPHYMIDVVFPNERFTVADFVEKTKAAIQDIQQKGKIPIIVGGTGLYLSALIEQFSFAGERSLEIREELEKRYEVEGIDSLYAELEKKDPESAAQLGKGNPRYILRALEAVYLGQPKSSVAANLDQQKEYCIVALDIPVEVLNKKINQRHAEMFAEDAILQETKWLLEKGYSPDLESMSSIGYKESIQVLNGELEISKAIELVQTKARQYAKRQRTWLRRMEKRGVKMNWVRLT